ncbi:ADP-ribose pyrophosphatase [Burkholderiaceae bacterium]|nr:ADP-ribose pyrophosphatase [Burkholderiaceae bacterium]
MKTTSCGILVCNAQDELLLCHATGTSFWDIPKGCAEAGESPLQTALREAAEECGLAFAPGDLLELGHFPYRAGKDLHLYAALIDRVDTARCRCHTQFRDRFGRLRSEMDDFAWVPFDALPERCAKSMSALLTGRLPIETVGRRLRERARVAVPRWWNDGAAT